MARRMFSPDIVGSDAFLEMPTSTRELYFQLGMYADDDGFVNPKKIMRITGASDDDLKVLLAKRFLISFENGVVVIKHWLIHNMIRKDRYTETQYLEQKKELEIKDNKAYTELRQPNGNQMATQVRLGKVRLGKVRLGKVRLGKEEEAPPLIRFTPEDMKLTELLITLIQRNNPDWQMKGNKDRWAEEINKLFRLDGRTYEQIEYMIRWTQKDSFWSRNILSTAKLRQKFNDLIPKLKEIKQVKKVIL